MLQFPQESGVSRRARRPGVGHFVRSFAGLCCALLILGCAGSPSAAGPSGAASAPPSAVAPTSSGAATSPPASGPATTAPVTADYQPAAPLEPRVRVRLADIQSTSDGGFYLALDKGYFAAEGLDVELERFDTAAAQVSAIGTNQLDVGVG